MLPRFKQASMCVLIVIGVSLLQGDNGETYEFVKAE